MEFFVMASEPDLINLKQKLTEQAIKYQIKTINNEIRKPIQLSGLFCRNKKNYYTILVKEEFTEKARKIIEQFKQEKI